MLVLLLIIIVAAFFVLLKKYIRLKKDYRSNVDEETEELNGYGFYEAHFDFGTSERYKEEIEKVRELQKQEIQGGNAAVCATQWTVNGSKRAGRKQTGHFIKLVLRAFNGECDAMVADVSWNNIGRMEARLEKSFEAINKLGETHSISITKEYRDLKLKELRLAHEYKEKLHEEKEEQRAIKERMREEEKAQREYERAIAEAKQEEARYGKALEQAKKELEAAHGEALEKLRAEIARLQEAYDKAKAEHERAKSMAEQTKIGHVYVISNIGSFGENVYKIGMTRRLEPMDRIDELGSASVPFDFDVHAMIESDNAPELESAMHRYFDSKRVNLVNPRKEFFNVTLEEIETYAKNHRIKVEFTKTAEARDYRESLAIRKQKTAK